ncbi:hypothetical protein CPB84DRAFT_1755779 [Gymnopilus junonius]|uniref:Uncharacterized protein n=1 Tax=Gymnopilus junonius TaxID=109634 RepID=A0A9P5N7V1_GYMJU|nr:hypothetical protein CPB84DRAFT_1755779 [Gymnopilus junonius]
MQATSSPVYRGPYTIEDYDDWFKRKFNKYPSALPSEIVKSKDEFKHQVNEFAPDNGKVLLLKMMTRPSEDKGDYDPEQDPNMDIDFGPYEDNFDFLPQEPEEPEDGIAGPGPQTAANQILQEPPKYIPVQVDQDGDTLMDDAGAPNLFAPFASELDWRVAQWAVKDGPSHNAFNRLLEIPGVVENLGLSYHNIRGLHQKLDTMPEKAGEWKTQNIVFKYKPEQSFMLRYRDPLEAVKSLWRDPQLSPEMVFASCKVFSDNMLETRIFSEMWTAKWWHVLQHLLPGGATLTPIIITTDKTQLTQFSGNKAAYPVYLTIGNIPKATRRKPSKHACILIAYLSVQKIDCSRINDQEHHSLVQPGTNGVKMTSSDGAVRCVHPILTCYVADYPEQCLVACTKYGTCPKCKASAKDLQNPTPAPNRTESWTNSIIQEAKDQANLSPRKFHAYCMSHDVAGSVYKPFWEGFPLCDIHHSITPDVLHQLYQGVFKHLVSWCQRILSLQELDHHIRALPPTYGLRPFKNGIFALSQISGMERKNMAKILLGCLVGCMPSQGIAAITALLDFIYIAQYPAHNSVTLGYLRDALNRFHQNCQYFITTSVHDDFNIPKFHSLLHYIESIELFGTTDNYNTEMFERLHIDFAKHGWRASNQCDEFLK